jgi:hypothetical protein
MSVGGRAIATGGAIATIDTGTSLMVIPELVADSIHSAIPGSFKSVSAKENSLLSGKKGMGEWILGYERSGLLTQIYFTLIVDVVTVWLVHAL